MKLNHSLGNHNLNLNGQLIRINKLQVDSFVDFIGKLTQLNINVSSKLSIGLGSTHINILEIL